jgi:glycosyltransferase involved in cell wall biosynthesis
LSLATALVHEWLTPKATGGSELVVEQILQTVEADLYALIDFESSNPDSYLYGRSIGTTFLQHLPKAHNGVQKYLPLLPIAIEQLDLRAYDLILSSSHCVAKGILTAPHQLHLCYCHTPMRYAWDLTFDYLNQSWAGQGLPGGLTRILLHYLRQWDLISANRVDYFIANSRHTARRIWRCYRRPAKVIYPPVDIDRFTLHPQKQEYYLTVARLVSYKQIPLIVQAFNELQLPLIVIGDGPERALVESLAGPHIQVLGSQPNAVVNNYMAQAKGFIYAACEDFGITLVEAQACGTPVIAYGAGGALETVRDAQSDRTQGTGLLFPHQTVASLVEAVQTFETLHRQLSPEAIRNHAETFSSHNFNTNYQQFLGQCLDRFQRGLPLLEG